MASQKTTDNLGLGIYNILDSEKIPPQASSDSSGWISLDESIELMR